jgi:XRE family aerobic/anaerobic benzoate catabolism transcriptional regulator
MDQLKSILTAREALYERALARLDTAGRTEDESLADLLALIQTQHFLD